MMDEEAVTERKLLTSEIDVVDNSNINDTGNKAEDSNKKEIRSKFTPDAIEFAILFMTIVVLLFTYVFSVVQIKGQSMENTLFDNDRVVIRKMFYEPKTYDIVIVNIHDANFTDAEGNVLSVSSSLDENIVKRVIATEGQTVDIDFDEGIVYVDGIETESDFTKEPTTNDLDGFTYPVTVPEGYVFVMGDNRNNSLDSRSASVGFVDVDDIIGKVLFRLAPFERFGTVD